MLSKFKEHLEEANVHYRLIRRKSLRKGKIRNIKRKKMKRKSCPESQTRRERERERERSKKQNKNESHPTTLPPFCSRH